MAALTAPSPLRILSITALLAPPSWRNRLNPSESIAGTKLKKANRPGELRANRRIAPAKSTRATGSA